VTALRVRAGVDLVNVTQLAWYIEASNGAMLEDAWTAAEREYAGGRYDRLAAQWAAKEAVMKVLGVGLGSLSLVDVEVASRTGEAPSIILQGPALAARTRLRVMDLSVSMSHEGEWATAFAVALVEEESSE
jgi:holo-[acyl-carrier protein] synthase